MVTEALAHAGLESSNLIVDIDFTKSNEWAGARSYNRRSLHHIGDGLNPYEQAISIIGKTLAAFDEDNLVPCFGFGDASTHYQDVFSFFPDDRFCNGIEEVLNRYREIVSHLLLAGPTSFAPIIEMAMTIVEQSGSQYHVLLIIADGQDWALELEEVFLLEREGEFDKFAPYREKLGNRMLLWHDSRVWLALFFSTLVQVMDLLDLLLLSLAIILSVCIMANFKLLGIFLNLVQLIKRLLGVI